jgi:hypothetical protein
MSTLQRTYIFDIGGPHSFRLSTWYWCVFR